MRKILCFLGEVTAKYQRGIARSLSEHAQIENCRLDIFSNFQAYGASALYGAIEKNIFRITELSNYDAIIVCSDTFGVNSMAEELSDYLKDNATCPVVYIRDENPQFYNVLVDDYTAFTHIIDHLVEHHKFKDICFMTGRMDLKDAQNRLQAYRDSMDRYGIEIEDHMMFEGDYWRGRGEAAVAHFTQNYTKLPEAIVCSNDYMAMSVLQVLQEHNIHVPEQVCLTGYDDIDEAKASVPPLSTVAVSTENLVTAAFEMIKEIWNGKEVAKYRYVEPAYRFRNSCGCAKEYDFVNLRKIVTDKEKMMQALRHSTYMTLNFGSADTLYDLLYIVEVYSRGMNFGEIFLCLCDEEERQDNLVEMISEYTQHMILKAVISEDHVDVVDERFDRKKILPDRYCEDAIPRCVVSLHEKECCIGYLVMKNPRIYDMNDVFQMWVFGLSGAMDRIRMYSQLANIEELRAQSYIDPLTQISNRRFLEQAMRKLYERLQRTGQSFCIISIDMDGLKVINDNYGHAEGDVALSAFAKILNDEKREFGTASRTGGDEFIIVFPSENEQDAITCISRIRTRVSEYNKEHANKPYALSCSIGYEYCRPGINMLLAMEMADRKMYQEKRNKKAARK